LTTIRSIKPSKFDIKLLAGLILWILFFSLVNYFGGYGMLGLFIVVGLIMLTLLVYGISYLLQSRLLWLIYKLWKLQKKNYSFYLGRNLGKADGGQEFPRSDFSLLCFLPVAVSSAFVRFLGMHAQLFDPVMILVLSLPLFLFVSIIVVIIWGSRAIGLVSIGEGDVTRLEQTLHQSMKGFTISSWFFYFLSLFGYYPVFSEPFVIIETLVIVTLLIFGPMSILMIRLHFQFSWNRNRSSLIEYFQKKEGLSERVIRIKISSK